MIISHEMQVTLETGCIIPLLVIFIANLANLILELFIIGVKSQYFLDLVLYLVVDEVWQ